MADRSKFYLLLLFSLLIICSPELWANPERMEKSGLSDERIRSTEDHIFGRSFVFSSRSLGKDKRIFVHLPDGYEEGDGRYPVIYVLDGKSYFVPFAGIVEYLSLYEMTPKMIVVAVESGDRLKEFTYTKADGTRGDWPTSGGAESFRSFLAEELIPLIDASYRTHPFRILAGHSLAGLFAVETFLRSPALFQTALALSPSLYWNRFEWLKKAKERVADLASRRAFLLISGEEKGEDETGHLSEFKRSVEALASESFFYAYRCFPEESHVSVALPGLFAGLKTLFEGWQFPGEAWQTGPEKVEEHFRALSRRFGFPVPIREDFLNGHAFHGLRRHGAPGEAVKLFEFCLSLYPGSAEAYEGIGEAFETEGMRERAVEAYRKALELDPERISARNRLEALNKNQQSPSRNRP